MKDFTLSLQVHPDNPTISNYLNVLKSYLDASHYVWDPGVDPYPQFTGPANPLPPIKMPLIPHVYLTAGFGAGVNNLIGDISFYGTSGDAYYTSIPLRLHYELTPLVSIAAGIEFWSKINNKSYYQDTWSTTSYTTTITETYQVTPLTLELYMHHWEKGLSIDGGIGLIGCLYQVNYNDTEITIYTSPASTNKSVAIEAGTAMTAGAIVELNFSLQIDEANDVAAFLTSEAYVTGYSSGTYNDVSTSYNNNVLTSTYSTTLSEGGQSIFGTSFGLGVRAGF